MINFVIKAVFILLSYTHNDMSTAVAVSEYAEPNYAKWGKLAMQETSKVYQDASIVDYKYEGRRNLSSAESLESFVLLLKKDAKSFRIRVTIRVSADSDELIDVKINELVEGK